MSSSLQALAFGAWAGLLTPLWLRGRRLARLLEAEEGGRARRGDPGRSVRAAHYALRLLALMPGSPWRNTCLYRSVAECLVLRRYGVPARLRLGVRREALCNPPFAAHAWVECDPVDTAADPETPASLMTPLVGRQEGDEHAAR